MLMTLLFAGGAFAQEDDGYVPQGFNFVGVSNKTFSVSDTKKVHFSRGNLQYNASQNKWRFAPRQYSYTCNDNSSIAQNYDGWIDLFAWGTSGWNSGATAYQPWSTSSTANYAPGSDYNNPLTGDYANADWGVFNKISNGGNKAGMWRTLTSEEWSYLIGNNATRSGKYGLASLQGLYNGLVILPDEWVLPNGLSFTSGYGNGYATNKYTLNEWHRMEAAGALFLPAAGCRQGTGVYDVGVSGFYWSSSTSEYSSSASDMMFNDDVRMNVFQRYSGLSVRLVRDSRESRGEVFDEDGASYKQFSVSATSKVRFSKGNLQYNAVKNMWRFAGKQYMCVGEGNANIAQNYNGWIDLFGWGTSGWNSGATAFQPWSTSQTSSDYYPGGSATNNLTGDYAQADWGVYNKITNGGNKAVKWRTLTRDEWEYLIGNNATRSGKYGMATIRTASKSYTGMVLLPDEWTLPSGVTFTAGYGNYFTTNTYTMEQWEKMESAGAVFLPAAGYRLNGTEVLDSGLGSFYWSSTYSNESDSWYLNFYSDDLSMGYSFRYMGRSVRLVKD